MKFSTQVLLAVVAFAASTWAAPLAKRTAPETYSPGTATYVISGENATTGSWQPVSLADHNSIQWVALVNPPEGKPDPTWNITRITLVDDTPAWTIGSSNFPQPQCLQWDVDNEYITSLDCSANSSNAVWNIDCKAESVSAGPSLAQCTISSQAGCATNDETDGQVYMKPCQDDLSTQQWTLSRVEYTRAK